MAAGEAGKKEEELSTRREGYQKASEATSIPGCQKVSIHGSCRAHVITEPEHGPALWVPNLWTYISYATNHLNNRVSGVVFHQKYAFPNFTIQIKRSKAKEFTQKAQNPCFWCGWVGEQYLQETSTAQENVWVKEETDGFTRNSTSHAQSATAMYWRLRDSG